jgi:hypothetical protein
LRFGAVQALDADTPARGNKHVLELAGLILYPKGASPPKTSTMRLVIRATHATSLRKRGAIAYKRFPKLTRAQLRHPKRRHLCDVFDPNG